MLGVLFHPISMETNQPKRTFDTGVESTRALSSINTSEVEVPEEKRRVLEAAMARVLRQRLPKRRR